ncbi:hypothetical protein E2986_09863 [Frieseomelitta varia]|uniref:Uncharacterized protein n=1 Tax=Frieseomelitta varia TaxID=561572 RepID=A0A833RK41_9HYME|nr:hypothetical protein E2986_09863 [Frieseomelitta varia]
MCDLIDLDSPDKDSLSSRLASPLIPIPTDVTSNNNNTRINTNEPSSLIIGKRDSLENNPFDMVLHKTTEYIQKKDDPFEITLEKALTVKCKKNASSRSGSLDLSNNQVLKGKETRQKLKINKTLDEILINDELNLRNTTNNEKSTKNAIDNSNNTNTSNNLPIIDVQDLDLSILNQSVMNDTLFEDSNKQNKNEIQSTLHNKMLVPNVTLQVPKVKRSFSQGEVQPDMRKLEHLYQRSLAKSLRTVSNSGISISSLSSPDMLNEGFFKSDIGSSVFSSLSNISSISKVSPVSSIISPSLMLSNGTMNRTFLESCSFEKSENTKLTESKDRNKETDSVATKNLEILKKTSLSDLTDRFNKLKARVSGVHISESCTNNKDELTCSSSSDIKQSITVTEKNETCNVNNKLIDVDVFMPGNNSSKEHCKSSFSDTSSDSVFLEGNKINKSILQEAKFLARTFEEMAIKTSSDCNIEDLITNNLSWTSELLPAFDDETSVNLIELPVSPEKNDSKLKNIKITKNENNDSYENKIDECSNKIKENVKDLEMELVEPISVEKRPTAITLLLDLKKLIETEKNVEANKLLKNLEKVLGINCESNTELLTTYFNATNNLSKSPQKSNNSLEVIKNVIEDNTEYSKENNLTNDSTESIKESVFFESINLNDVNTNKCIDNQKYLNSVNNKLKCETSGDQMNIRNINKEKNENEFNDQKTSEEKVVIDLLANIGKLLQTKEHPTLDILKNLGAVLNVAYNCNVDENIETKCEDVKIQRTSKKSKLKSEKEIKSSFLSKSANRLSLNLDSKKQAIGKNFIRRSISVSQAPSTKSSSSINKDIPQLEKRYSSDPNFINPSLNKKVINNNKNQLRKDTETKTTTTLDSQKEKISMISTVKTKLKKKIDTNITNKKGPMKAIIPIRNMQKRDAVNKKITSSVGGIISPESHEIISSTPNSITNEFPVKKSGSSKPVASSTPDAPNSKTRKIQSQLINSPKKRNFFCDISPVTTRVNVDNNNTVDDSPRRSNKLPSPKKTTPKHRRTESGIPKAQTPPISKRLHSSFEVNHCERVHESPRRSVYKKSNSQRYSPVSLKKNENIQRSPLRDNNKLTHKVKPINLISKLQRHNSNTNAMDKENSCV